MYISDWYYYVSTTDADPNSGDFELWLSSYRCFKIELFWAIEFVVGFSLIELKGYVGP